MDSSESVCDPVEVDYGLLHAQVCKERDDLQEQLLTSKEIEQELEQQLEQLEVDREQWQQERSQWEHRHQELMVFSL